MEIKFNGSTFRGTAEGDHGVFTKSDGTVFEGEIANGSACVGVATETDGYTWFVECDADGWTHGRVLTCTAGGDTYYRRYEHGSRKEYALLRADGTCHYNGEDCRAGYAPFVALRAKVVPIKARRPLVPPQQPPLFMPPFSPPPPPRRSNRPLFWHSQELATTHADKVRAQLPPPSVACMDRALHSTASAKQMHHASNLDAAPGRKGALRMGHKPHA